MRSCFKIIKRSIVVGLDVGTCEVKAALGVMNHLQDVHVLGMARIPSVGLRKGNIIDIESTSRSIDKCLNELERLTGREILSTVTGFSSISITAVNNRAVIAVGNPDNVVATEDKERVLSSATNISLAPDKTIVQVIERQYIIDGYDGVRDPVGMVGNRLEAEALVIYAAAAAMQNLQRSAQRINLSIEETVYNQLLIAESVLLPAEKEMGVVLIDMGAGTTEISIFSQGTIRSTAVLPIGGDYITKDLAIVLRTSIEEGTRIKEQFGLASPELASDEVMIEIHNIQGNETKQVPQKLVAEIISARVLEMMEMIYTELQQSGDLNKLAGGIVFTGGGAQLQGIVALMEDYMDVPVRLGRPDNIRGLSSEFNQPQNSVALGGLICGLRHMDPELLQNQSGVSGIFDRINYWVKDLFS